MNKLNQLKEKFISAILYYYIDFVYKSSKVNIIGNKNFFENLNPEKYIFFIWHGDSYCYYPFLKGKRLNIVTTINKRGGVISRISKHFGYDVIQLPDYAGKGDYIFKLKKKINKETDANLVMSVDGPSGPNHEIKDFAFIMALFSKRKIVPLNIDVKYKIKLKNRWDKLKFPFPFNQITIKINDAYSLNREDRKDKFTEARKKLKEIMEKDFRNS
ncbi:MAG: hypothetical protein ACOCRO_00415 [Halanaerobiales bacterium]